MVGMIDFFSSMILLASGFSFYRQPRSKFLKTFPLRPLTLLAPKQSASPNLSYFYRPHKSTTHRPIVFVHGLGVGLAVYIPLFLMIPKDIGIIAIEVLPISSRITEAGLLPADQVREIGDIITQQNFDSFVFIGNSYGTFLTKLFLETSHLSSRMARIVLIDPVAVLLHVPDLTYNATTREPKDANEIQITWAATTEPDIAFTLAKRFCWRSHILWREDLSQVPTTVVLGSEDCLVNAEAIAAYITKGAPEHDPASVDTKPDLQWSWADRESWKLNEWSGEGLELYWLEGYDHGQGLFSSRILRNVVRVVERYCARDVDEVPAEKDLPQPPEDDDAEDMPEGSKRASKGNESKNGNGSDKRDSGTT